MATLQVSSLGHQLQDLLRAKDNGIHKSFTESNHGPPDDPYGGVRVRFGGESHHKKQDLADKLYAYRAETGIRHLLPFQVEATLNMVFRPQISSVSKTIVRSYGANPSVTRIGTSSLASPGDDIGMMAINDLFTGSGKTLTTILSAIAFADSRKDEIVQRVPFLVREQSPGNWSTRTQFTPPFEHHRTLATVPAYTNVVVVMCAKHLVSQWKRACASALQVLGMDAGTRVLDNPLPSSQALPPGEHHPLQIVILHSANNLARLSLQFVPVIIVDEFTIKSTSNVLTKPSELLPLHGRLLLVSADAGNIRNIIYGSHRRSYLRRMVQWDDISFNANVQIAMAVGIPLISASVLPTEDRFMVGEFMIDKLKRVRYEKYIVRYTPSFTSRIFGSNFEMSALTGTRLMKENYGIDLTGPNTVSGVLRIVDRAVDAVRVDIQGASRILKPLLKLRNQLNAFVGERETCPICLQEHEMAAGASLINPCWHIVCETCMRAIVAHKHTSCPMCRTKIEGHASALVDGGGDITGAMQKFGSQSQGESRKVTRGLSLIENMNATLRPTAGLETACIDTLRCIQADVIDKPYRIIMIVPEEHFFIKFAAGVREKMDTSDIDIIEFKASGNKRKHVTEKMVAGQLESFASDGGRMIKILFTTEGKTDSLTGLDFPQVDCIISLGDGNSLQRLGRLTRLPRIMEEGNGISTIAPKLVRYVCLEPLA